MYPVDKLALYICDEFCQVKVDKYVPGIACRNSWSAETLDLNVGGPVPVVREMVRHHWVHGRKRCMRTSSVNGCSIRSIQKTRDKASITRYQEERLT